MATEHAFPDATAKIAANFPKEFDPEKMSISMGPSHPSTHGVLRIQFELDGETVTRPIRSSAICTAATRRSPRT